MSDHSLAIWGFIIGLGGILIGVITAYYFYLKARIRINDMGFRCLAGCA